LSAPLKSYGIIIAYGNQPTQAASTTWTDVTFLENIEPPSVDADDIDVTTLTSANEFRAFIAGYADGGEGKFTVQWDNTQSVALYGLFRTQKGWRITLPGTGGTVKFDGYIKGFGVPVDEEGIITNEITIKVTGQPAIV
jgi:hypothetical protein